MFQHQYAPRTDHVPASSPTTRFPATNICDCAPHSAILNSFVANLHCPQSHCPKIFVNNKLYSTTTIHHPGTVCVEDHRELGLATRTSQPCSSKSNTWPSSPVSHSSATHYHSTHDTNSHRGRRTTRSSTSTADQPKSQRQRP